MDDNKKFWEKVATFYTPLQERSNRELYDEVIFLCRDYLREDQDVLELACGTGQFTLTLCSLTRSWEATDFSPRMVEGLRKRLPEDCRQKVSLSVQDATDLSYEDSSYDTVFMANALHVMPDPESALKEVKRVLKPGGLFIVPTFVYDGKLNKARLWILDKAGFRTFSQWSLSGLEDFLERNGFRIIRSERIAGKLLPEGFVVCRNET